MGGFIFKGVGGWRDVRKGGRERFGGGKRSGLMKGKGRKGEGEGKGEREGEL